MRAPFVLLVLLSCHLSACGPGSTPPPEEPPALQPPPELGVNYNATLSTGSVKLEELSRTRTRWVRGIFNALALYNNFKAGGDWQNDTNILGYFRAKDAGYRTILSIRWDGNSQGPIPHPSDPLFADRMAFLEAFLQRVMPKTDLVVQGNEPFVEALEADKANATLVEYHKEVARRIRAYLVANGRTEVPLYIGSFDDAWKPYRQNNPAFTSLLQFADETEWVTGIDLHIHHDELADITSAFAFVQGRMRNRKQIIVTEFSLKPLWDAHRTDPLTPEFLARANQSAEDAVHPPPSDVDLVWEYMDYAIKNPRPQEEWNAWNQTTPWLEQNKSYLCASFEKFASHPEFRLGMYAMRQGSPAGFSATDGAWILNHLLLTATVAPAETGGPHGRYTFFDDFKALREGTPTSCASP